MLRKLLSEPLLHFALAGFAIFGLFALTDDTPVTPSADEIVVTDADARRLADQYEATWRRPPQPEELDALIDEFIKEEVLVREALALGLDQNDTIVRRRLRQKMEFLSEAPAASATPDDAALLEFLNENSERFARPPRIAFEQVLLEEGAVAAADALEQISDGVEPWTLGAQTLLPPALQPSAERAVDGMFGNGFFDQIAELAVGDWQGPVNSGFGAHLVRVESFEPAILPPLDEIKERVELEWRAAESEAQRARFLAILTEGYVITRPLAREVLE